VNTIYLFTSGLQESVMLVGLKPDSRLRGEERKERLRQCFAKEIPTVQVSFEAADIITRVMSFGSPTPVEIAVQRPQRRCHPQLR
jgi:hypothetical protein